MSNYDGLSPYMEKWRKFLDEMKQPFQSMFPASMMHPTGFLLSEIEVEQKEREEKETNDPT